MSSLIPTGFQFPPSLRQCVETVFAGEYDIPGEPKMPGARVLDIGANVGQFTSWVIDRFGVSPQDVEAYEPNPGAVNLYRINSPLGCYVHKGAVTVRPGPVALYLGADWGYTSIDPKLNPRSDEAPILVPTVHPAILPACEILKIDAEGVELEILQNYRHLSGVCLLFVEIHRTALRLPCEDIAIRAGLELARAHRFTERGEEMALECWRRP